MPLRIRHRATLTLIVAAVLAATHSARINAAPGAYSPSALTDEVNAAANFAVREEGDRERVSLRLERVAAAEKQIVAGTNYRLVLLVGNDGSVREAKAIVFRDLKSQFSLTSWHWL